MADCILTIQTKEISPQVDEFLGQLSLPLREFDVYERPRSKYVYIPAEKLVVVESKRRF